MSKALRCTASTQIRVRTIPDSLKSSGFDHDGISVLFPDKTETTPTTATVRTGGIWHDSSSP